MTDPADPPAPQEPTALPPTQSDNKGTAGGKASLTKTCRGTQLQRQVLEALERTDVTINRLYKLVSTSTGQEAVLKAIEYLSHALHHLLRSAPWIALQTRLGLLARIRAQNRGKTTTPASTPTTTTGTSSSLLRLIALISQMRYTLRLLGLIPLWAWGSGTIRNPPADPVIHILTLVQVVSNTIYQLLENVAFLASKDIFFKRVVERYGGVGKWYLWSTRAWFGHVVLQFFNLWRQSVLIRRRHKEVEEKQSSSSSDNAEKQRAEHMKAAAEIEAQRRLEIRTWKKGLVNNMFWAPLCLHWSLERGIGVPSSVTGLMSFLAGAWQLHDSWQATAAS